MQSVCAVCSRLAAVQTKMNVSVQESESGMLKIGRAIPTIGVINGLVLWVKKDVATKQCGKAGRCQR